MVFVQRATSLARKACASRGVVPQGSAPCACSRSATISGRLSAASAASFSFARIGAGSRFGAASAYQAIASNSGTSTVSAMVGHARERGVALLRRHREHFHLAGLDLWGDAGDRRENDRNLARHEREHGRVAALVGNVVQLDAEARLE
jgi:hypothetical protein